MAAKQKKKPVTAGVSAQEGRYADPVTGTFVDLDMQAPKEVQEEQVNRLMKSAPVMPLMTESQVRDFVAEREAIRKEQALRKIPEGMNKYTPTNEWLMLILESLYRLEAKLEV